MVVELHPLFHRDFLWASHTKGGGVIKYLSHLRACLRALLALAVPFAAGLHAQLGRSLTAPVDPQYTEVAELIGALTKEFVIRSTVFTRQPPDVLKTNIKCEVEITCTSPFTVGLTFSGSDSTRPNWARSCLLKTPSIRVTLCLIRLRVFAIGSSGLGAKYLGFTSNSPPVVSLW